MDFCDKITAVIKRQKESVTLDEQNVNEELTPKKKRFKDLPKWKRVTLIAVLAVFALLVIVGVGVAIYLDHLMNQINIVPKEDVTISSKEVEDVIGEGLETIDPNSDEELPNADDITFPSGETDGVRNENVLNILMIGQDRRPGEGRTRSDSMILATINLKAKTVTLTSFLRDAYVQIPGYQPQKLNHAYAFGGMSLLNETLRINYGVIVDGNVEVDFSGFKGLIDMLGGVDIDLTQAEANWLNNEEGWSLHSGMNHLSGKEALAYSRIRYLDTDYRRTERQRTVIMSIIDEYKTRSVNEMLSLLEDALPMVTTNMEKGEILDYAVKIAPVLAGAEYTSQQIPVAGSFRAGYVQIRPGYQAWLEYDIDFEANRKILQEIMSAE